MANIIKRDNNKFLNTAKTAHNPPNNATAGKKTSDR